MRINSLEEGAIKWYVDGSGTAQRAGIRICGATTNYESIGNCTVYAASFLPEKYVI